MNRELIEKHNKYIEELKNNSVQVMAYNCPLCAFEISRRAPEKGEKHSEVIHCPACEDIHYLGVSKRQGGYILNVTFEVES